MTRDEAMMEPIEKVALAMLAEADSTHLWDDLPPSAQADLEQLAKAAIRAVLDGVELVAWHYASKGFQPQEWRVDRIEVVPRGWTETPLYPLDALKEALDHEQI